MVDEGHDTLFITQRSYEIGEIIGIDRDDLQYFDTVPMTKSPQPSSPSSGSKSTSDSSPRSDPSKGHSTDQKDDPDGDMMEMDARQELIQRAHRKESRMSMTSVLMKWGLSPSLHSPSLPSLPHSPPESLFIYVQMSFTSKEIADVIKPKMKELGFVQRPSLVAALPIQSNSLSRALLTVGRILSIQSEGEALLIEEEDLVEGRLLSLSNELRAIRRLILLLQKQQQIYPYPLSHYEDLLSVSHLLDENAFSTMRLQWGELVVLQKTVDQLRERWNGFLSLSDDVAQLLLCSFEFPDCHSSSSPFVSLSSPTPSPSSVPSDLLSDRHIL